MSSGLRIAGLLAIVIAGCAGDRAPDLLGGGNLGGRSDPAMPGDADGGADTGRITIAGRACLVFDLRAPAACPAANLGGLVIDAGALRTQTDASGRFELEIDAATESLVLSTGFGQSAVQPSVVQLFPRGQDLTDVLIPVVDATTWARLTTATAVIAAEDSATIIAYIYRGNTPAAGATAITPPAATPFPAYYEGFRGGPFDWIIGTGTGVSGTIIFFGVDATSSFVDFSVGSSAAADVVNVDDVAVLPGAITFLSVDL